MRKGGMLIKRGRREMEEGGGGQMMDSTYKFFILLWLIGMA